MAKKKARKQSRKRNDVRKKKAEKLSPFEEIQTHVASFLNDLDCIIEAFDEVDPVLEEKDKKRRLHIETTIEKLGQGEATKATNAERYEHLMSFMETAKKLGRGHLLYRNNSLISLVSRFDEFIGDLIRCIHKQHPDRLKKSEKALSYEEITSLSNIQQAVDRLIDKEVDKILRDSHAAQIKYFETQLSVQIKDSLPVWKDFIELTERRNLIVHCGGEVSTQYLRNCRQNNCSIAAKFTEGSTLNVEPAYFRRCHEVLVEVSIKLSQIVLRNIFPKNLYEIDLAINNYGVDLLRAGRWNLALMVFEYLGSLPPKMTSEDYFRRVFIINKAIGLKFSGKNGACQQLLAASDWTSCSAAFTLALAVLRDDFDKAEIVMSGMNGKDPIEELGFTTWPIFREFRKTDHFRRAFKGIYKRDFELVNEAKKVADELQSSQTAKPSASSTD